MNDDYLKQCLKTEYLHFTQKSFIYNYGLAIWDLNMMQDKLLKLHTRKITFSQSRGLYVTYLDNKTLITSKTLEGLQDKICMHYLENADDLFYFPLVLDRALQFNLENNFLSQSSCERYLCDYNRYLSDNPVFSRDISAIGKGDLTKFFLDLLKTQPTAKAVSNVKTVLRLVFNHARLREGYECLDINAYLSGLSFPKRVYSHPKQSTERVFSDDQRALILSNLTDSTLDLGIKLAFYTGLRVGELCSLQKLDIDFENKILHVLRSECVAGKGDNRKYFDSDPKCHKTREVFLCDAAIEILYKLFETDSLYLFPFRDFHYHKCSFDRRLRTVCSKLNLPSFSMHDIRRTYASRLLDAEGVTDKFVQEQLGHSDIRTTQRYYYYTTKRHSDYLAMANKA